MPLIELTTVIHAPVERFFDLSRSIDLHKLSMEKTGEQAIGGVIRFNRKGPARNMESQAFWYSDDAYVHDRAIFPEGCISLDNVMLMRGVRHKWIVD